MEFTMNLDWAEFAMSEVELLGTLPISWVHLQQLDTLIIQEQSGLEGSLPAAWSAMKALKTLEISG
jgi:hypothetical protein